MSPATAAGSVKVTSDTGADLGTVTVTGGTGSLALVAQGLTPGSHVLKLAYAGNATHQASTGTVTVVVSKAEPTAKLKVDKKVRKGKALKAVVKVSAPHGIKVTGKVKLVIQGSGKSFTAKVVDGKAVFELPKFTKVGKVSLRAVYLGSDLLDRADDKAKVTVTT